MGPRWKWESERAYGVGEGGLGGRGSLTGTGAPRQRRLPTPLAEAVWWPFYGTRTSPPDAPVELEAEEATIFRGLWLRLVTVLAIVHPDLLKGV